MYYWYFKLFNNIKDVNESEEFAKLEIESLFGKVEPIYNFFDKLKENPLSYFTSEDIRIQDFIIHELPYGKIQGYFGTSNDISMLMKLVKRLAYTREIYLISSKDNSFKIKNNFPIQAQERIYHFFEKEHLVCFRFITYQYFLEKSEYISKLSRNEGEVERNVEILFSHLIKNIYRIPSSPNLSIGKRLEDYFAIREEPSLYLTHYFHPYKGKFHPKMARALLNYVFPKEEGIVMDNFAGSGTLLVEASLMELKSIGIEINPLSVLMSNVKCNSLLIDTEILKGEIENYFERIKRSLDAYLNRKRGQLNFISDLDISEEEIEKEHRDLLLELKDNYLKGVENLIPQILICKKMLSIIKNKSVYDFLLLALSGTISDIIRRKRKEFIEVFEERVNELYLRLYLFKKLNEVLCINVGKSICYEGDTRDMSFISDESIDGIVNSPPYSVALDYVQNDYIQLVLLKLTKSISELDEKMIGNPRASYDKKFLLIEISSLSNPLPNFAKDVINYLLKNGRQEEGLRSYKFFIDMNKVLKEMWRVMKNGSKCAIIIGNNHFKVGNSYIEVPNDKIIMELAQKIGFIVDKFIIREIHKSSKGNIREESVIILKKEV